MTTTNIWPCSPITSVSGSASFGDKTVPGIRWKAFDDYHASRVLPGFEPDSKLRMLMQLSDQAEIIIAVSAADITKNKIRYDLGITYDVDVLRLIHAFTDRGLYVGSVVITHYSDQPAILQFKTKLGKNGDPGIPPLHHRRLSQQYPPDRQRRRLWQKTTISRQNGLWWW